MAGPLNMRSLLEDTRSGDPNFQLDVGSVLYRTLSVGGANIVPFFLVGLVVQSPVLLALAALGVSGTSMPLGQRGLDLLSNLLSIILTGGVTYGVFQALRGQAAGVGEVLRLGLSRLGTVWGTGVLSGLATMLGFCALIIPGLILMTRYWVAVPVAVIEEPGAFKALERSTDLTEGNRWRVFAAAIALAVPVIGISLLVGMLVVALEGTVEGSSPWSQMLVELAVIPVNVLAAVGPAIAYHDLRVGKEGVDVEELLKAFE
jgi:hypothetical protein